MDLSVGQTASRSLTLTAEHVEKYAEICWLSYEAIASDLLGDIVESARSVGWRSPVIQKIFMPLIMR